ncbi:hypothetical protein Q1695_011481 [Nippostrongylus brasiliensis]|nr:hypothetical protein Q1695_011481 [Nippostrongylus brasiliensis]
MSERYMVRDKRAQLAEFLGLSEAQVKTWFQNRRAKDKREKKGGSTSPQRSPSDSANVSLADDSILDTSQASTMSPSPPAAVPEPTPPPELKPQITPSPAPSVAPSVAPSMATAHQAISTLLQPRQLQEFPPYFSSLGLAPLETIPSFLPPPPTVKTEPGCAESTSKEIYKLPFNIYDHPYPALYAHIPLNLNPISSANSPSFIPEPLAPIANTDTLTVEHTQLTAL